MRGVIKISHCRLQRFAKAWWWKICRSSL